MDLLGALRSRPLATLLGAAAVAAAAAGIRRWVKGDTGNPLYTAAHREMQARHETTRLAGLLEKMARPQFDANDRAFVEAADMVFVATVDSNGMPTCSYKGGAPGFCKVTGPSELTMPMYDGNGMWLTLGNIESTAKVGLLFIDFAHPKRLRAQGIARASRDPALLAAFPGAQYLVVISITYLYVNCGRYIHKGDLVLSPHVPNAEGKQPIAGWKRLDVIASSLSEKDMEKVKQAGGVIGIDKYRGEEDPDLSTVGIQSL